MAHDWKTVPHSTRIKTIYLQGKLSIWHFKFSFLACVSKYSLANEVRVQALDMVQSIGNQTGMVHSGSFGLVYGLLRIKFFSTILENNLFPFDTTII